MMSYEYQSIRTSTHQPSLMYSLSCMSFFKFNIGPYNIWPEFFPCVLQTEIPLAHWQAPKFPSGNAGIQYITKWQCACSWFLSSLCLALNGHRLFFPIALWAKYFQLCQNSVCLALTLSVFILYPNKVLYIEDSAYRWSNLNIYERPDLQRRCWWQWAVRIRPRPGAGHSFLLRTQRWGWWTPTEALRGKRQKRDKGLREEIKGCFRGGNVLQ